MNQSFHVIYNKMTNTWVAVSEHTHANGKQKSASSLSRRTGKEVFSLSRIAGSLFLLMASGQAWADCNFATNTAPTGASVVCTGTTTGPYDIPTNSANVNFSNEGTITATGTQSGSLVVASLGTSGFNGSNSGTISWSNAQPSGTSGGRAAVIVSYFTGSNSTSGQFINTVAGQVIVDSVGNLNNGRGVAGMSMTARNGTGTLINNGTVSVTGNSTNPLSYIEGLNLITQTGTLTNNGVLNVTATSGASVSGAALRATAGSGQLTNSGTIVASGSGSDSQASFSSIGANTTSANITNSGSIELKGGVTAADSRAAVAFGTTSGASVTIPMVVTNTSTGVIKTDSVSRAISFLGTATNTSAVHVKNSGVISGGTYSTFTQAGNDIFEQDNGSTKGDIWLGNGNNTFTLTGGSVDGNLFTGTGIDKYTMSSGNFKGNVDMGAGNDTFVASGGTLAGNVLMGQGDDMATVSGTTNVTSVPQFDGGVGADVLNVNGLTLRGFTAASNDGTGNLTETNNSNLTGWETINVQNTGTLKLSNNLFTAANVGTLNVDASSTLDLKGKSPGVFTIFGNVNNSGLMTMADGAGDDATTITGNYTGVAGSKYNIDTFLGNDASATDKLIVNGNTSGATTLSVTNVGGTGAQTVEGIQVVRVDGSSNGSFSLTAPVQAGSYEYTLQKNGVSTPTDGDWYLRSTFVATCANTPSLCPAAAVYRPAVANYLTAQSANADAGFLQLSTLHQRMSEQRTLSTDKAQTWGRLFTASQNNNGKSRFNYEQNTTGFQFGRDLLRKTDAQGKQQRAGLTIQYAHSSIDSEDVIRPLVGLGKDSGSTSTTSVGLGGYFTQITKDGTYIDIVSQVNRLTNKFKDSYSMKSKQRGWQFGLSGEVGKPVAQVKGWSIEPQAQLSYLYSRYTDFSDLYSNIDGFNAHNLKARLGLRLHKDVAIDNKNAQYYGIVNILHDVIKPKTITLNNRNGTGQASVNERFDKTSWELGAGIQGQVAKNTYLFADARYERSFKSNKEAGKVNLGVKTTF